MAGLLRLGTVPHTVGQLRKREVSGRPAFLHKDVLGSKEVEASLACGALGITRLQKPLFMIRSSQSPQTLWPWLNLAWSKGTSVKHNSPHPGPGPPQMVADPSVGFQASSRHVHFNSSKMSLSGIRMVCLCLFISLLSPPLN